MTNREEMESRNDRHPQHEVTLHPFLLAKYEVRQAEWEKVIGTKPWKFKGQDLPVETFCHSVETSVSVPHTTPYHETDSKG